MNYEVEFSVGVEALDRQGETVELSFNSTVEELSASDITVRDAITNERRGIASVQLGSDGRTAQVSFLQASGDQGGAFLEPLREYNFELTIPGVGTATTTFERPAFLENTLVTDYNADNGRVTIPNNVSQVGSSFTPPEGTDLEAYLGQLGTFAVNSNSEIVNFFPAEQSVEFGAVLDVELDDDGEPESIEFRHADGEVSWIDLQDGFVPRFNGELQSLTHVGGPTADYAKLVLNSAGEVAFYDAYDFEDSILVEGVDEGFIQGFGDEVDAEDLTIVEDGQTISLDSISTGDHVFYNEEAGYAVVYNEVVTGTIDRVFSDSFRVNGVDYDFEGVRYIDADGEVSTFTADDAEILEDLAEQGEDVVLYLNHAGELSFFVGDLGQVVVGENGAYLTSDPNAFTEGNRGILELSYSDVAHLEDNIRLVVNDLTEVDGLSVGDEIGEEEVAGFAYRSTGAGNGFIAPVDSEGDFIGSADDDFATAQLEEGHVIEFLTDSDGEIIGFQTVESASYNEDEEIDQDDLARVGDRHIVVNEDLTVRTSEQLPVFLEDGGDLVGTTTWGSIEDFEVVEQAEVYYDEETQVATYLVIDLDNTDVTDETTEANAVVEEVRTAPNGTVVEIDVYVDGSLVTYQVDNVDPSLEEGDTLDRGQFVELEINQDDVVVGITSVNTLSGTVTGSDFNARTFTIDSSARTFQYNTAGYILDNRGSDLETATFRDVTELDATEGEYVTILPAAPNSLDIDVIVIHGDGDTTPAPTEPVDDVNNADSEATLFSALNANFEDVSEENSAAYFTAYQDLLEDDEDFEFADAAAVQAFIDGVNTAQEEINEPTFEITTDDDEVYNFSDGAFLVEGTFANLDVSELDVTVTGPESFEEEEFTATSVGDGGFEIEVTLEDDDESDDYLVTISHEDIEASQTLEFTYVNEFDETTADLVQSVVDAAEDADAAESNDTDALGAALTALANHVENGEFDWDEISSDDYADIINAINGLEEPTPETIFEAIENNDNS